MGEQDTRISQRYIFAVLAGLANILTLAGRNCLYLAIVEIAKDGQHCHLIQNHNVTHPLHLKVTSVEIHRPGGGYGLLDWFANTAELDCDREGVEWSEKEVADVLGAFFWGIFLTEVLSGPVIDMLGGKIILTIALLTSATSTLLVPFLSTLSVPLMVANQLVSGLANGFVVPSFHSMISRWEPSSERGRISTIIYSGGPLSSIICLLITGWFASKLSWVYAFYFFGCLPFGWVILWLWCVYDNPEIHPRISKAEMKLLSDETHSGIVRPRIKDIPIKKILTSKPVWAMVIANTAYNWSNTFVCSMIPKFYSEVFEINMDANGMLSTLPFISNFIFSYVATFIFNTLVARGWISTVWSRKLATSVSLFGMATCVGLVPLLGSNIVASTALFTSAWALTGAHLSGAWGSAIDIAPNFAASLMGLSGLFSYFFSGFLPAIFSSVVTDESTAAGWGPGLYLTAAITVAGNLIFLIFGTSDVQDWNTIRAKNKDLEGEVKISYKKQKSSTMSIVTMESGVSGVPAEEENYKTRTV